MMWRDSAVWSRAFEVMALPCRSLVLVLTGVLTEELPHLDSVAALHPRLRSGLCVRIGCEVADDGAERLELATALRHDHAERLARLEANRMARARELPVHRERCDRPVRLDEPFECSDAVLRPVRRAASEQVVPR